MNALTLELDEPTEASLTDLCHRWGVPPDEVVRRALKAAASSAPAVSAVEERLAALRELQRVAQMTPEKAAARKAAILDARR